METYEAYIRNITSTNKYLKVFDWKKAAEIIKEETPKGPVYAGLQDDMEWTGGIIWEGKPILDKYTYLSSTWAIPILVIGEQEIPCWISSENTSWDAQTKWPEEALNILK